MCKDQSENKWLYTIAKNKSSLFALCLCARDIQHPSLWWLYELRVFFVQVIERIREINHFRCSYHEVFNKSALTVVVTNYSTYIQRVPTYFYQIIF